MKSSQKNLTALLLIAGLTACAGYRPDLPEDLGERGLLVAQIGAMDDFAWLNDAKVHFSGMYRPAIVSDAVDHVIRGYVAIPLSEGEYSLAALSRVTGNSSISMPSAAGGGAMHITHRESVPINKPFKIKPGTVTNLGLLVVIPASDTGRTFRAVSVDNNEHMRQFLRTHYPALTAKLPLNEMTLAPGDYARGPQLAAMRREVMTYTLKAGAARSAYCIAGPAGTLGYVERKPDGGVAGTKYFNLDTVAKFESFGDNPLHRRCAGLTSDRRLFVVSDGRLQERALPAGVREGVVTALGGQGLVIVDNKWEIYTSADNGATWKTDLSLAQKDEDKYIRLVAERNGFYLYRESGKQITYRNDQGIQRSIPLPPDAEWIESVTQTRAGLYLHTGAGTWSYRYGAHLLAEPHGTWESLPMPQKCNAFTVNDAAGKHLSAVCEGRTMASKDGGRTWERLYRTVGTFESK